MYKYVANVNKVGFKDYLPTPLTTLTPLIPKRQLVVDIENSSKYIDDFPVLEKIDNFDELWSGLLDKVSLAIPSMSENDYSAFMSKWSLFHTNINAMKFEVGVITTLPRAVLAMWPIDFSFLNLNYKDKKLIEYFDAILTPSKNTIWQDLMQSTENVFDDYIHSYIKSMGEIREIKHYNDNDGTVTTDAEVINLTAKMLGMNLRDELLNAIGPDRLAAIVPMLGQFYEINSTDDFVKIIELVISSQVLIDHLYSKDYINFKTYDKVDGPFIYDDSSENMRWFKTTHVNLFVEYNGVKYLTDSITAPLGSSVMDIVNLYLPINLVVKNFGLYFELNTVETAPNVFFGSVLDSVVGNKTVASDTRRFSTLIPLK